MLYIWGYHAFLKKQLTSKLISNIPDNKSLYDAFDASNILSENMFFKKKKKNMGQFFVRVGWYNGMGVVGYGCCIVDLVHGFEIAHFGCQVTKYAKTGVNIFDVTDPPK